MRDIRFRVWDTMFKEMIMDVQFRREERTFDLYLDSRYSVMQFTGLHDKNGKEIWEGDILQEISELSEEEYQNRVGQVLYENRIASFMILTDGGYCQLNKGDWNRGGSLKFTEVIGNVYENPTLLNKEVM